MKITLIKSKQTITKCIQKLLWLQLSHQITYSHCFQLEKYIVTGLNICLKKTKVMSLKMNLIWMYNKIKIFTNKNHFQTIISQISKMKTSNSKDKQNSKISIIHIKTWMINIAKFQNHLFLCNLNRCYHNKNKPWVVIVFLLFI